MDETARSATNLTCPRPTEETQIAEQVARSIGATGRLASRQLNVSAAEGVVTLRGHVSSYYQKQMAQTAALRVEGVHRLENRVQVY